MTQDSQLSPATVMTESVMMKQLVEDMMDQRKELHNGLLDERRKERRSKNIRFGLIIGSVLLMALSYLYIFFVLGGGSFGAHSPAGPYAAIVQLKGEIADGKPSNAVAMSKSLTQAFKDPKAKGIILYVNSPGGSPVQSSIIYDRIIALKDKYPEKRIVTVATDNLASGSYFIASATDKIFVNRSTITGSIGVINASFGFSDLMERFGIERRVYTAGDDKNLFDPYLPQGINDEKKMNEILVSIHNHFIDSVKNGRGERLDLEASGLFEGNVWTGGQALEIGLVDGLSDLSTVMDQEFGVEQAKDYTVRPALINQLMKFAASSVVDQINTLPAVQFQ